MTKIAEVRIMQFSLECSPMPELTPRARVGYRVCGASRLEAAGPSAASTRSEAP